MKVPKIVIVAMSLMLSSCTVLTTFNTLTPKDPAVRVLRDEPYGSDPRQKLDIYAPPGAKAPLPVVVFFYGGGWYEGRRQDYSFAAQALASRGFLVVVPDYRVYPQAVYPVFLQDCAAAVRWVQDHAATYGGDASKIMFAGHSAGAYNAVELALDDSFLKAAGVDMARIKGAAGLSGPYDFLPLDVKESKDAFGAWPDLPATQPINHVHLGAPPLFLAHGDKDQTVGLYNTEHLTAAMKAIGAPVETHIYSGVDHEGVVLALSRPFRGNAPVLDDLTAFLRRVSR